MLFWEKKISAHNGLMLTVLGNFGWLAFGLIQVPTVVLLGFGWKKCIHQKSALGRLVGIAVMLTLTWQTLAVVVQDLIGLDSFLILFPYPFLNDGGMALLLDCALLGLLLSIFRGESIARDAAVPVSQVLKKETV